jgi:hypothetical protein
MTFAQRIKGMFEEDRKRGKRMIDTSLYLETMFQEGGIFELCVAPDGSQPIDALDLHMRINGKSWLGRIMKCLTWRSKSNAKDNFCFTVAAVNRIMIRALGLEFDDVDKLKTYKSHSEVGVREIQDRIDVECNAERFKTFFKQIDKRIVFAVFAGIDEADWDSEVWGGDIDEFADASENASSDSIEPPKKTARKDEPPENLTEN